MKLGIRIFLSLRQQNPENNAHLKESTKTPLGDGAVQLHRTRTAVLTIACCNSSLILISFLLSLNAAFNICSFCLFEYGVNNLVTPPFRSSFILNANGFAVQLKSNPLRSMSF